MKKSLVLTLGLFITLIGMMSCGNSGDDEARQKAIRDSLYNDSVMMAKAEAARIDSMYQDSLMQAQQALQDSMDAAAAAVVVGGSSKGHTTKPKVTPKPTPKPPKVIETGKGAIKNRGNEVKTSGKGAIKNRGNDTGTGKAKSGKGAIKNRNK